MTIHDGLELAAPVVAWMAFWRLGRDFWRYPGMTLFLGLDVVMRILWTGQNWRLWALLAPLGLVLRLGIFVECLGMVHYRVRDLAYRNTKARWGIWAGLVAAALAAMFIDHLEPVTDIPGWIGWGRLLTSVGISGGLLAAWIFLKFRPSRPMPGALRHLALLGIFFGVSAISYAFPNGGGWWEAKDGAVIAVQMGCLGLWASGYTSGNTRRAPILVTGRKSA